MSERLSGHTLLVSLLATPIRHSLSPKMHNEAYAKLGLDYAYLAFEVGTEQLADAVQGIRALGIRGSNVSMPNKEAILPLLDDLSQLLSWSVQSIRLSIRMVKDISWGILQTV